MAMACVKQSVQVMDASDASSKGGASKVRLELDLIKPLVALARALGALVSKPPDVLCDLAADAPGLVLALLTLPLFVELVRRHRCAQLPELVVGAARPFQAKERRAKERHLEAKEDEGWVGRGAG